MTNGLSTRTLLAVIILGLLLYSCAEVGSPPGGEPDRTGPRLLESSPTNGALNVPIGNEVTLTFSERIVKPSKGTPVFVSPRPETEPKIKWKRDRILIEFAQFFQPDQTYIINVSNQIRDLRNNPLDSNISIAFSTGDAIDSGHIAGQIIEDNLPATGFVASLYRLKDLNDSIPFDSIYPYYIATTDKAGKFEFKYLPEGEYKLIGFRDKNSNDRFNPTREPFALPDRPIVIGGELSLDNLVMPATTYDTATTEVISAAITNDGLLRLRFNKPITLDLLNPQPANLQLFLMNDTLQLAAHPARGLLEYGESEAASVTVCFDQLPVGSYNVEITYDATKEPLTFDNVEVTESEDESPPVIAEFLPDNQPMFLSEVKMELTFSEPIDPTKLTDQSFLLWEDNETVIPVKYDRSTPFLFAFDNSVLNPGHNYRMDIAEFDIHDYAGNQLGDSLQSYEFSTLDEDSLGSISGEVAIDLTNKLDAPVILSFKQASTARGFIVPLKTRQFHTPLPPGNYLLSGFIDEDLNGRVTPGSIIPAKPAETEVFYPDTIAVRARFETAGIVLDFK